MHGLRTGPLTTAADVFDRTTGTTTPSGFGFLQSLTLSASGLEVVGRSETSLFRRVIDTRADAPPLNAPTGNP